MSIWRSLLVLVFFLTTGTLSYAQTPPCGDIIVPAGFYELDSEEERTPVDDCANPFNADASVNFTYQASLSGTPLTPGQEVTISATATELFGQFNYAYPDAYGWANLYIFRNEGDNYWLVDVAGVDNFNWREVEEGEYTAVVVYEFAPVLNQRNWWERLRDKIIPTAHAYFEGYKEVTTFDFSVVRADPPPAGASSVLFLPGIMGSRLYEENGACSLSGDIEVRERWLEVSNCDLLRLETNFLGESTNDIFTFSDDRGQLDRALLPDFYDSFIDAMESWQSDDLINGFRVVPYDWRMSIDDVINTSYDPATRRLIADDVASYKDGYLYKSISELAATSLSGKVTIVTHSNGGLVAKGLLRRMSDSNDPLLQKIDRLIMVAAPQVGTPEALLGLLHGIDLGFLGNGDAFLDMETSRLLQNKMAFAHHLLPNANYFNRTNAAVVTFDDGPLTTPWKQKYGQIRDRATLHTFLDDESGRPKPEPDDLLQPEIVDAALLTYARNMETLLNWTPPSSMQVIQVAGTGLDTTAGLTYFTDRECVKHNFGFSFLGCAEYQPKIGYRVNSVIDGDQTVVAPSALYMPSSQAEQWWVDMPRYNLSGIFGRTFDRKHSNIFEVSEVVSFIENKLFDEAGNYNFISNTAPELDSGPRLTFQLHSPLDLAVVTDDGEVSSTTIGVTNAVYRKIGEVQYLSLPADTPNTRLRMRGYATGSFTLDIERREGNEIKERQTFSGVPSATSTVVTAAITPDLPPVQLSVDVDGNGTVDMRYDEKGVVVEAVTYAKVRTYIQSLTLKNPEKKLLLAALSLAEKQFKNRTRSRLARLLERVALQTAEKLVEAYGKRKLLSAQAQTDLGTMLKGLIEQTK